jgi:hypothetical protein
VTLLGKIINANKLRKENLKERPLLEILDVDDRLMFKRILNKQDGIG